MFESDDWGGIRIPSGRVIDKMVDCDSCNAYNLYDTLENSDDLELLLDALQSSRRSQYDIAKFTLNFILGNPNFERIRECGFTEYVYERFIDTYLRVNSSNTALRTLFQGIDEGLYLPQFHGREHVSVLPWLKLLKEGHKYIREIFDLGMFCGEFFSNGVRTNLMATYNFNSIEESRFLEKSIYEGTLMFEEIFGFRSVTTIAPSGCWHNNLEWSMKENGIRGLQGFVYQLVPEGCGHVRRVYHFLGQRNSIGQTYLIRNCFFEPTSNPSIDWVDICLRQIKRAFLIGKPAIISSHRVNYVSGISMANRDQGLFLLRRLLSEIVKRWSEVEFMSTAELFEIIEEGD